MARAPGDFKTRLWRAIDAFGLHLDDGRREHAAAGLLYLRAICSAFEIRQDQIRRSAGRSGEPVPLERRSSYEPTVVWIPRSARWPLLLSKTARLGRRIDHAIRTIERANPALRGAFPRGFGTGQLKPGVLRNLVEVLSEFPLPLSNGAADELWEVAQEFLMRPSSGASARSSAENRLLAEFDREFAEARRLADKTRKLLVDLHRSDRPLLTPRMRR